MPNYIKRQLPAINVTQRQMKHNAKSYEMPTTSDKCDSVPNTRNLINSTSIVPLSGYAVHTGSRWQCPNYWDKTVEPCHLTKQTKIAILDQVSKCTQK